MSPEQVEQTKDALSELVRRYGIDRTLAEHVPGKGDGKVTAGDVFQKRAGPFHFQLEAGQQVRLDDMDAFELQVRKLMWLEDEAEVFRTLLALESPLPQLAAQLLGDVPLLYQSMALIKPPKIGATKPWHQDNAYFSVTPLEAVVGVWIAIDEATVKNGCMHMLRGQHQAGPMMHEHRRDCEIPVRQLDLGTLQPVPLKPGGALFFSGLIPHETPPNRSEHRRRALQFHFRGARSTLLPGPEYDQVFKDAGGRPASCATIRKEGA